MIDRSKYEKLTFDELKDLVRDRELKVPGRRRKKQDYVDLLNAHDAGKVVPAQKHHPHPQHDGGPLVGQVPNIVDAAVDTLEQRYPNFGTIRRALTREVEIPDRKLQTFWAAILVHTESISFPRFQEFVSRVLGPNRPDRPNDDTNVKLNDQIRRLPRLHTIPGTDLYALLKTAAEAFLLLEGGVALPEPADLEAIPGGPVGFKNGEEGNGDGLPEGASRLLPRRTLTYAQAQKVLAAFLGTDSKSYLRTILPNVFPSGRVSAATNLSAIWDHRYVNAPPLIELIWSYWIEMGFLCQTMNAITLRFQNVRRSRGHDPLKELTLDPLRPLSGIIWGFIQDQPNQLSLVRRAYEYLQHYGVSLFGKAVPELRPADPRTHFIEAFHTLLRECDLFIKLDNDMTVNPDAFAVLNALKDVHMTLSENAHNQFREVPWTARAEMLIQQWMIARPEMREFLRGRLMVSYPEQWMGGVDAMKRLQDWNTPSSIFFNDLARYGERLLLSIRYVAWNNIGDQAFAKAWVRFWKEEIQGYIHAYQVVTGVNLTDTPVVHARPTDGRFLPPNVHLRNRMLRERSVAR
jgi:hypothetical protein